MKRTTSKEKPLSFAEILERYRDTRRASFNQIPVYPRSALDRLALRVLRRQARELTRAFVGLKQWQAEAAILTYLIERDLRSAANP